MTSSRSSPIPYFPIPPAEYNQQYFSEIIRAFSVYTQQIANPGPIRGTQITLTTSDTNVDRGTIEWNNTERTLNVSMGDGIVQQVGYETYMLVKNDTGATIANGTVVGFSGVSGEITIAPYVANSASNELYFIGVTTTDMPDQYVGSVTIYGKVRGLDTTGPGAETWSIGNILYVSPTTAGLLTNIRPTAPNAVIVVAAVLSVDATNGEIMVRPTTPIGLDYGSFDANVDQSLVATNTATPIALQITLSSNGVTLSDSSRLNMSQSGFYQIDANIQMASGNSSTKTAYFWMRKNGTDVTSTTRAVTSDINNGFTTVALNYTINLNAGDYIELYWAGDNTNLTLDALAASAFAPSSPSVLVKVSQLQL